jgi:hypothetical protein
MKFTKWPELLGELNTKAGMDTFIIQRLFFRYNGPPRSHIALKEGSINVNDPQYSPSMVLAANDPTNAILNYADQTYRNANQSDDMKIYVGLWMDEMPWPMVVDKSPAELEAYLNGVAEKLIKVANLAWNLYHQHPSFRGWYISHEFWNFPYGDRSEASQRKQELFKKFLSKVVAACKELNKKPEAGGRLPDRPVALSVYFNPWLYYDYAGPPRTEALYTSILTDSGLDVLMVQDSIGTRCLGNEKLDSELLERKRADEIRPLVPYFLKAFGNAARAASTDSHKIALWDDVEAFEIVPGTDGCHGEQPYNQNSPLRPTNIDRLKWQFSAAAIDPDTDEPAQFFEKFVIFDLFHYLNRVVPEGFGTAAGNTQAMRTGLFDQYLRTFVNQPFNPQPGSQQFTGPVVMPRRQN